METMRTERLIIRNFRPGDWRDLYEMAAQYRQTEWAKYDHPWPEAEADYPQIAQWFADGDSYYAVALPDTDKPDAGKVIGFVCLNPEGTEDGGPVFNIGYVFNADYHGQGYAYEACRAVVNYGFRDLGAARLITGTPPTNLPSVRLLERLGLRATGEGTWALPREDWLAVRE